MIDRTFTPRPKGLARPKSQPAQRDAQPGKAEAARAFKLAACGTLAPALEAHHVLPASWLKQEAWRAGLRGGAYWKRVYDPGVAISLPVAVHAAHTNRVRIIAFEEIPHSVLDHVYETWGDAGIAAVEREHPRASA